MQNMLNFSSKIQHNTGDKPHKQRQLFKHFLWWPTNPVN